MAIVKQVNENLVDLFSMVQNVIQCDLSDLLLSQRLHSLIFKYWPYHHTLVGPLDRISVPHVE